MNIEVTDLRKGVRFTALEPLHGVFGACDMTIADLGLTGLQIAHSQPLRIGTRGRLAFHRGDITIITQARVVWSQYSNQSGKLLYRSGLKLEESEPQFAAALNALFRQGVLQKDTDSLERKRARAVAREEQRRSQLRLTSTT